MTDKELEQLLRRQRLTGPSASLRDRVLRSATGEPLRVPLGRFDYAAAAVAAGLVLAAALIEVPEPRSAAETSRQAEIAALAQELGGGPDALRYAELVISRDDEPQDPAVTEERW
jgi:hypothetical protein